MDAWIPEAGYCAEPMPQFEFDGRILKRTLLHHAEWAGEYALASALESYSSTGWYVRAVLTRARTGIEAPDVIAARTPETSAS